MRGLHLLTGGTSTAQDKRTCFSLCAGHDRPVDSNTGVPPALARTESDLAAGLCEAASAATVAIPNLCNTAVRHRLGLPEEGG